MRRSPVWTASGTERWPKQTARSVWPSAVAVACGRSAGTPEVGGLRGHLDGDDVGADVQLVPVVWGRKPLPPGDIVNHASGAVAPPDAEVVQVGDAIWQWAERPRTVIR